MFITEPSLTQLTASPDEVLSLLVSLNRPMVALEDHPTDEGEATICSLRRDSEMVSTYVHLCLYGSATGMFYRYEVDPYPEDLRDMVEGEALSFAESLGFIMDNTNFSELDDGERKQYLESGPFAPGVSCSASRFSSAEAGEAPSILGEQAPAEPVEAADPAEPLDTEPDSPGIDEEDFNDDDVDDAVRALIGEPQETPDFDRAVEEFIGEEDDEEAVAAPAGEGESRAPLSRFQRRPSGADIYAIRGLAPEAAPQAEAPDAIAAQPAGEPDAQAVEELPPPALEAPSGAGDGDSEARAKRARARYLASF